MKKHFVKNRLLFFLLLFPLFLSAQDWQNICSPGKTFFVNGNNSIEGIRFSSVQPLNGQDTLFTTYNHWRSGLFWGFCSPDYGPLFLHYVLKRHDGWFIFYDTDGDSLVYLNTQSHLNDSWIFYKHTLYPNSRVDAEVTALRIDTILGIVDSVKIMTLTRKDTNGNIVPDSINGKLIILGKHLGLVQTRDFFNLLNEPSYEFHPGAYYLAGKSDPKIGMQELTGREIFNYQVGDIFHYSGAISNYYLDPPQNYQYTDTRQILKKDSTATGYHYTILQSIVANGTPTFHFKGIVNVDIAYTFYTPSPWDALPGEVIPSLSGDFDESYFNITRNLRENILQEKEFINCGYHCNTFDGCNWGGANDCYNTDHYLAEGLGMTHLNIFGAPFGDPNWTEDLKYYKKGNYTWGSPLEIPDIPFGYRVIPSDGNAYYSDDRGNVKMLKIDSVKILSGNDSVFFTYPAIRKSAGVNCLDSAAGSLLGRKILQKEPGVYQLLNSHQDTLTILSAYDVGTTWTFCHLSGNNTIEATILSKSEGNLFGIVDTLKIIAFQAKDSGGQNIEHPINGKTVTLSNSYGFTLLFDFYMLPDTVIVYHLVGLTSPRKGVQDLTWDSIYQFRIGDQFIYTGYEITQNGANSDSLETKTFLSILDKKISGINDTLYYSCAQCQRIIRHLTNGDSIVTTHKDTINLFFTKESFPYNNWIDKNPDEFYPFLKYGKTISDHYFMTDTSEYYGRALRGSDQSVFTRNTNGCWIINADTSSNKIIYANGLGKVLHESLLPGSFYRFQEKLVWYSKQNEIWGTPVTVNCDSILGLPDPINYPKILVKIVPSPVKTNAVIIVEHLDMIEKPSFKLYDVSGKEVLQMILTEPETPFDRWQLPSGFYTWRLVADKGVIAGKIILE